MVYQSPGTSDIRRLVRFGMKFILFPTYRQGDFDSLVYHYECKLTWTAPDALAINIYSPEPVMRISGTKIPTMPFGLRGYAKSLRIRGLVDNLIKEFIE